MGEESLSAVVYGSGATTGSMFSSLLPYVGMASLVYGMISSGYAAAKQKREQGKLAKAQMEQAKILHEKIKADNASLYSSALSSVSQSNASMGAVY